MNNSRAPLILILAIVLLLLPVLYVGSYLALVEPQGIYMVCMSGKPAVRSFVGHYRVDNRIATIFWPLEQIDRKVRPASWSYPWERTAVPRSGVRIERWESP